MPAPYIIIIAVSTPILYEGYIRIKEYMEEQVTEEELYKIIPVLEELGLTLEEILNLDTEKEISDQVAWRLHELDEQGQIEIMDKLRECLDQDEYFEIRKY